MGIRHRWGNAARKRQFKVHLGGSGLLYEVVEAEAFATIIVASVTRFLWKAKYANTTYLESSS